MTLLLVLLSCAPEESPSEPCTDAFFADGDGDGHGDATVWQTACTAPSGYVAIADDCNDASAAVHPSGDEICNAIDDDCDGAVDVGATDAPTWFADRDADGFGDDMATTMACTMPAGHVATSGDCDDTDSDVRPGGVEVCDDRDNDCDALVDAFDPDLADGATWYVDADGDHYGDPTNPVYACEHPEGTVEDDTDCDDASAEARPGLYERCDGIDNDCNGLTDDEEKDPPFGAVTVYIDADLDGFGDNAATSELCVLVPGWSATRDDCDDGDPAIGAPLTWWIDEDGDGIGAGAVSYVQCLAPTNGVTVDGDCNDFNTAVFPGAVEVCNDIDDNCDAAIDEDDPLLVYTSWYADADQDGYGDPATSVASCDPVSGYVDRSDDCDDTDPDVYAGAPELCDLIDNDCDTAIDDSVVDLTWYSDYDGDGFGNKDRTTTDCDRPPGYVLVARDCDDASATTFPGAVEVCNNDVDDDCDFVVDDCVRSLADALTIEGNIDEVLSGAGTSLATADLNGDGVSDLLVGCHGCDHSAGQVSIFYGPMSASAGIDDGVIIGSTSADRVGADVETGDLDGDGNADIVVGADDFVYYLLGPITSDVSVEAADTTLTWDVGYGSFGFAFTFVHDVDGDGGPDVMLGSGADCDDLPGGGSGLCGAMYVTSGALSGAIELEDDATYLFYGIEYGDVGNAGTDVGDTNGDGIADLAVCADQHDLSLIDGGLDPGAYEAIDIASGSITTADDDRPLSDGDLANADYDGDGWRDLIVGSHYTEVAYGFFGPVSGTLTTADASVRWVSDVDRFGISLDMGDVDADGEPDLLFGATYANDGDGAAYVQFGKAAGVIDVSTMTAIPGERNSNERLGTSVVLVPDWTGDGGDEIALGAPNWANDDREDAGRVYVLWSEDVY